MPTDPADAALGEQLMRIALEPELRRAAYDRIGEYCHQCRNRLNSLKLSLYLAMKQADGATLGRWSDLQAHYLELERTVERLQTLCRPMDLSRVVLPLGLLFEDRRGSWTSRMLDDGRGRGLELVAPANRAVASFDVERLGQALDSLVEWRAAGGPGDRPASLRWWVESGLARVSWEEPDSGPAGPRVGGSPWTLPLLARVVIAHGGDCSVSEERGWRIDLTWPAATSAA